MNFLYPIWLGTFWSDLTMSLDAYEDHSDSVILMGGLMAHDSVDNIRAAHNLQGKKIIVYQTEPLVDNHWWNCKKVIQNISGADEVWDYDYDNMEILKQHGISSYYKPPLYSPRLNRVSNKENPKISVLFYGTLTKYRTQLLYDAIHGAVIGSEYFQTLGDMKIISLWNVTGSDLDEYISNSKIIINLNPYDGKCIQQKPRISYALNNNKFILSERSNRNYYGDMISEFTGFQELIDKLLYVLKNDTWRVDVVNQYIEYSTKQLETLWHT